MKAGILGRKLGMTQIVDENGEMVAVTVVEAGPCSVVQLKTAEKDGYSAAQFGYQEKRAALCNKADKGHFNAAKIAPVRHLKEFRTDGDVAMELGQSITVDIFSEGDSVDVTGISRGKGTAGVMKRWGFSGGKASHGAEKVHRAGGSIGSSADPSRVFKGRGMPGRMGNARVTIQNITVAKVRKDDNILLLKGAVPGHPQGLLIIRKAKKKG